MNMPGGAPTLYRDEYKVIANKLAKLGLTDVEMADYFEVHVSTLHNWKIEHPEFFDFIKRGRLFADADVADKLHQRAIGYEHDEVHVSNYQGQITLTPLVKHYPPSEVAAIFWLKNRNRKLWRNNPDDEPQSNDAVERAKMLTELAELRKIVAELSKDGSSGDS